MEHTKCYCKTVCVVLYIEVSTLNLSLELSNSEIKFVQCVWLIAMVPLLKYWVSILKQAISFYMLLISSLIVPPHHSLYIGETLPLKQGPIEAKIFVSDGSTVA